MTPQQIKEKFRQRYKKTYKGILPDEILEQSNKWFEDFLDFAIKETLENIYK